MDAAVVTTDGWQWTDVVVVDEEHGGGEGPRARQQRDSVGLATAPIPTSQHNLVHYMKRSTRKKDQY